MLDTLPDEVWNPDTTFLDPCCKTGIFLIEIYNRLDRVLSNLAEYKDPKKRRIHILSKQLYGFSLFDDTMYLINRNLYGDILGLMDLESGQIINNVHYLGNTNAKYTDMVKRASKDIEAMNILKEVINKETSRMEFDVVIGNPPYQESTGGGGNSSSATAIYHSFMDLADEISTYRLLVIPSRWMSDRPNGISEKWLEKARNRQDYLKVVDYSDSRSAFSNVNIAGGVCYVLTKKDYKGKCMVTFYSDNKKFERYGYLANKGIIIRDMNISLIVDKIYNIEGADYVDKNSIYTIIGTNRQFSPTDEQFKTSWDGFSTIKTEREYIKYFANSRVMCGLSHGYVSENDLADGTLDLAKKYKLFIPLSGPTDGYVIKVPFIGGVDSCCSRTFAPIATDLISNDTSAYNAIKYFKTKFLRALVSALKSTQHAARSVYKLVPLQDFTYNSDIDWTKTVKEIDQQLYKKYNLTDEEIAYIEKTIKPME